jgi:hypothetical protein
MIVGTAPVSSAANYGKPWITKTVYYWLDSNVSTNFQVPYQVGRWNQNGKVKFVRTYTKSAARVTIQYGDAPSNYWGYTWYWWDGYNRMYKAKIVLEPWVRNYPSKAKRLSAHELGHAYGLNHDSRTDSIMNPCLCLSIWTPTYRNLTEVARLNS